MLGLVVGCPPQAEFFYVLAPHRGVFLKDSIRNMHPKRVDFKGFSEDSNPENPKISPTGGSET